MKLNYKGFGSSFALGATMLGLFGCGAPPDNFRVSVSVNVNGTLHTGSSVQRFRCHKGGGILGGLDVSQCVVKGEAVVVDLGDRGLLFLTFKGPQGDMTSMVTSMLRAGPDSASPSPPARWQLSTTEIPLMVNFRNLSDAKSVQKVDPNDLSDVFGPGVSLNSVFVEKTSDPITWGNVYTALPWIKTIGDHLLDGHFATTGNNLSSKLQKSDFIYGE